jgi:hypothetical protein
VNHSTFQLSLQEEIYTPTYVIYLGIAKDRDTIKEGERGGGVCMSGVILVCLLVENVQACETPVKIL